MKYIYKSSFIDDVAKEKDGLLPLKYGEGNF